VCLQLIEKILKGGRSAPAGEKRLHIPGQTVCCCHRLTLFSFLIHSRYITSEKCADKSRRFSPPASCTLKLLWGHAVSATSRLAFLYSRSRFCSTSSRFSRLLAYSA